MAYDYVKKNASSVKQNDKEGGQAAQLKKAHSNASMASMLGEGDFSDCFMSSHYNPQKFRKKSPMELTYTLHGGI